MLYNPIAPIRLFAIEMSNVPFDELCNQVQGHIKDLESQAQEFPTMLTLDQKRQAITRSNRDFQTMQNKLTRMERLIQIEPPRDRESFAQSLTSCRTSVRGARRRAAWAHPR
jgi:hypothetical protein